MHLVSKSYSAERVKAVFFDGCSRVDFLINATIPEDAFRCFMGTGIEMLPVGNCLLRKEAQDPALLIDYAAALDAD